MYYLLVLLVLFPFFVGAQDYESYSISEDTLYLGPTSDEEYEEENVSDLSNFNVYYQPTIIDNVFDVPAYNLYYFWDTEDIHPYKSKMNLFPFKYTINFIDTNNVFSYPIRSNRVTSNFGWRKWRYHYGIDIGLNVGDTIISAFDGVVRIAKYSKSYGYTVVVRHYNGLETLYAHLSKILVEPNQEVFSGQIIGLGGNTGRSRGPHLHFEIRFLGAAIDPEILIDFNEKILRTNILTVDSCLFSYLTEVHKARYHVVRKGETLSKIARRYGVSVVRLRKLNNLGKKTIIRPGQRIRYT